MWFTAAQTKNTHSATKSKKRQQSNNNKDKDNNKTQDTGEDDWCAVSDDENGWVMMTV
jgi:hypothetical protein